MPVLGTASCSAAGGRQGGLQADVEGYLEQQK